MKKPQTLIHVARGFLRFSGADRFPPEWVAGQTVHTRLWFFHVLPGWWRHTLAVAEVDDARRAIHSRERGGFYTWNHTIQVSPAPDNGSLYSDEIEIAAERTSAGAGLLTVFVWLYANVFYRYRQARWRRLMNTRTGFYTSQKTRLLKQFDQSVSRVRNVLASRYGEALASGMIGESRQEFEALIPQLPYVGGEQPFTQFVIATAWFLAMYRALKNHGSTVEEAGRLV